MVRNCEEGAQRDIAKVNAGIRADWTRKRQNHREKVDEKEEGKISINFALIYELF